MENVKINVEKMQVESTVSLTNTYEELQEFYSGNSSMLNHTFPLLALGESKENLKKRFVGEEEGLYYYTFYPWTIILTKLKDE